MSFGKKKSAPKPTAIQAPPPVTTVNYVSPLGDTTATTRSGSTQTTQTTLGPSSQELVSWSQLGSGLELDNLVNPSEGRRQDLQNLADDVYQRQADQINLDTSQLRQTAQGNLSRRFGHSVASTFGNQLLADIEGQGLKQRTDARLSADMLANDLDVQDEERRIQRLNTFQNILNNIDDRSRGLVSTNSSLLQNETNRATDLAIVRAKQLDDWNQQNYQNQRQSLLARMVPVAGRVVGSAFGALGSKVGSAIGSGLVSAFGSKSRLIQ
ncbi:MAG: hypothetical protein QE263_02515 [Vampirovibrionales bacterium]|nr:hypothetical protein [Vampirovibrionales bacterium]